MAGPIITGQFWQVGAPAWSGFYYVFLSRSRKALNERSQSTGINMFTPEKIVEALKPLYEAKYYHDSDNYYSQAKILLKITKQQHRIMLQLYKQAEAYLQK